jgi:hypothetical protein
MQLLQGRGSSFAEAPWRCGDETAPIFLVSIGGWWGGRENFDFQKKVTFAHSNQQQRGLRTIVEAFCELRHHHRQTRRRAAGVRRFFLHYNPATQAWVI